MSSKAAPEELKYLSDSALEYIKSIERCWDSITGLITGTTSYWEGDASNAHIRIYKDVEDDVNEIITRLKDNLMDFRMMNGIYEESGQNDEPKAAELPADVF